MWSKGMDLGSGLASAMYYVWHWRVALSLRVSVFLVVPDDLWGFLLDLTICGLFVIGLSDFSPLVVTSVVDFYHGPTGSMAKHISWGVEESSWEWGELEGRDASRFPNLPTRDMWFNKRQPYFRQLSSSWEACMLLWKEQRGDFWHWLKLLIRTLPFTNWVTMIMISLHLSFLKCEM